VGEGELTERRYSAGVRLGLYGPVKELYGVSKERPSMLKSIAAGCTSGAIAAAVSNPIDLIKTRLQAQAGGQLTSMQVVRSVVASDGLFGLWKGTVPSMVRPGTSSRNPFGTASLRIPLEPGRHN
jgi:solute carrier family 25 (mitochondrial uncoupling protein), member 8/9